MSLPSIPASSSNPPKQTPEQVKDPRNSLMNSLRLQEALAMIPVSREITDTPPKEKSVSQPSVVSQSSLRRNDSSRPRRGAVTFEELDRKPSGKKPAICLVFPRIDKK